MWNIDDMDCINNDHNSSDHAPFPRFTFHYPIRKREKENLYNFLSLN